MSEIFNQVFKNKYNYLIDYFQYQKYIIFVNYNKFIINSIIEKIGGFHFTLTKLESFEWFE